MSDRLRYHVSRRVEDGWEITAFLPSGRGRIIHLTDVQMLGLISSTAYTMHREARDKERRPSDTPPPKED